MQFNKPHLLFGFIYKVATTLPEDGACASKHVGAATFWLCVLNLVRSLAE
jgi:hypothetical protein